MTTSNPVPTFDIIIVGGGTSGSLLAAGLSTNPAISILVLEAGQNRNSDPNVRIPGLMGSIFRNLDYDWGYQSAPESGLNGRVIQQPRGRLWGGSSAINSHALVYPSRKYHDAWGNLIGKSRDGGTKCDWGGMGRRDLDVVSAAESEERKRSDDDLAIRSPYPVSIHVLQRAWSSAIKELGCGSSNNPIDGNVIGGSTTANAVDTTNGERSHAGVAFLEPSSKRGNMTIWSNVTVDKIILEQDQSSGKLVADRVLYTHEGSEQKIIIRARKEVVVCAGTFGSTGILERLGIGQRERLDGLGVECLRDLQGVGENLQDHLNFGPSVEVHDYIETNDVSARDPSVKEARRTLYESKRAGALAEGAAYSFSYLPLQALSTSDEQSELSSLVDLKLHESSTTVSKGLRAQYDVIRTMIQDPTEATSTVFMARKQRYTPSSDPAPGNYISVIPMLSYPFSRGSSHITSTHANVPPHIQSNYLQHPLDVEIFSRHVLQIGQILEAPSLSSLLKKGGNILPTGYPRHPEKVEHVEGYLRQYAATNYHPCGTCAMMSEQLGGVVNEDLIVYGTTNLRICDVSIIPIVPRGNILSTVYALAEKGADILRESLSTQKGYP